MPLRSKAFSASYRAIRRGLVRKGKDLETVVIWGDRCLTLIDSLAGGLAFDFKIPEGIGADLFELRFPSPLTFASFKDDASILAIWLKLGIGGGALKTILREPRPGNPRPRLFDTGDGLINAMGLPGKGVAGLKTELRTSRLFEFGRPIGISIGGNSVLEYEENFKEMDALSLRNTYFELNISCPNTPEGQDLAKHPELLEKLLRSLRFNSERVIGVKVSPGQSDDSLRQMAEIARSIPKIYLNAGNTQFRKYEKIAIGGGGQSGLPLFKRTLEMTKILAPFKVPIMATGGISSIQHIDELRSSGATLFGLATALVKDPYCIPRLNNELAR